ncbi:hypothetical protein BPOR_0268g00150 [Botrytis porri]|uniref:Uncharacterized protein n=1 Tax=Botrytis porri TaxID=87229 RepID=A0A4Z1KLF8_9HELO|nr:hypothetical protein BPOR_0268g00150 [Botrytis porri]
MLLYYIEEEGLGPLRLIEKTLITKSFEVSMDKLWFAEFFTVDYFDNIDKSASITGYENVVLRIAEPLRPHTLCICKPDNEIKKHLTSRAGSDKEW